MTTTTIKRTIVKFSTNHLTPAQKVKFARDTQNTAKTSPAFQGSTAAQASMAVWLTSADGLDLHQAALAKAEQQVVTLRGQEPQLLFDFETAAADYGSIVQTLGKGDPSVVAAMGLSLRAKGVQVVDMLAPLGLLIATSKKGVQSLVWDKVLGARLYVMQISVDPATETSWVTLMGGGRRRKLVGLVQGQKYLLRVKALGAKRESPWSQVVGIAAK